MILCYLGQPTSALYGNSVFKQVVERIECVQQTNTSLIGCENNKGTESKDFRQNDC